MKVSEIFEYYPRLSQLGKINLDSPNMVKNISKITASSKDLQAGEVFCAYAGTNADGHQYISDAIKKGAIALVIEDETKLPSNTKLPILIVKDGRAAFELLSSKYFNESDQKLYTIGVTGTNGKTSITYLAEYLFANMGTTIGVMGTVNHRVGTKIWETNLTTPDPWTLHERLQQFHSLKAAGVILEVSSHALDQKRVNSLNFDAAIFTNLTRDHLDYHKTMSAYFKAKESLFYDQMWKSTKSNPIAIINGDDVYGRKIKTPTSVRKIYYGMKASNDFSFKITERNYSRQIVELKHNKKKWKFEVPLIGEHTIYNLIPVLILGTENGISIDKAVSIFKSFPGVPGRLQKVDNSKNLNVFVDYAHSPDALENVLKALISVRKQNKMKNKIVTVFGCGGDRDKGKRPLMGAIAERLSDKVIVTSDNPRTEDPQQIIKEIIKGIKNKKKQIIIQPDRALAIKQGIDLLVAQDVLIICGKGHEDYQIIGTEKKHFSDYAEVKKNIEEK